MCGEWAKEVVQVIDVMETRAPRNGIEFPAQIGKSRIGEQYIYIYRLTDIHRLLPLR